MKDFQRGRPVQDHGQRGRVSVCLSVCLSDHAAGPDAGGAVRELIRLGRGRGGYPAGLAAGVAPPTKFYIKAIMLTGAIIGALIVGGSCKAKGTMHYAKCTMVMPCSEQSKMHHAKCVMVTLNAHALVESRK